MNVSGDCPFAARLALPQTELLLGEDDDAPSFGGLVGKRRQLSTVDQLLDDQCRTGQELDRMAIAQRDGTGLVEQQRVHVAGRFDRPTADRDHVVLGQPIHSRDADRGQQPADGRGNEADEQRDQHRRRNGYAAVGRERLEADHREQEDDGEPGQQDGEGDFVGRPLTGGALDEGDHPVDEGLARIGRDADDDPVGEHPGAAGDGRTVAAAPRG